MICSSWESRGVLFVWKMKKKIEDSFQANTTKFDSQQNGIGNRTHYDTSWFLFEHIFVLFDLICMRGGSQMANTHKHKATHIQTNITRIMCIWLYCESDIRHSRAACQFKPFSLTNEVANRKNGMNTHTETNFDTSMDQHIQQTIANTICLHKHTQWERERERERDMAFKYKTISWSNQ